ncbi:unnamed protein product [Polarella glacialis]|uniref:TsaA-like domain-containing protein n=1 Tax=Polarella glacialis TaxID=89957 RepID=A0A813HUJ9_POLGL|nr:unnamed protein product [Polarella glacialis]CAE8724761.1 unnamed protein product [Polarella glacialis]
MPSPMAFLQYDLTQGQTGQPQSFQHTFKVALVVACAAVLFYFAQRRRLATAAGRAAHGNQARHVLPTSVSELTALIEEERRAHGRTEKRRQDELAGRRNAEEKLRQTVLRSGVNVADSDREATYPIAPIATAQSCFMECGGVPRQPGLASATRAVIQFNPNIGPGSFDGLMAHSHVWVLFVFHCNTNAAKSANSHENGKTFKTQIAPPLLGGSIKVGVLATRTPHHPNPIGLSLARLESVDAARRRVVVCGSDLVDGTPVLDIKPYIPFSDIPRDTVVRVPDFSKDTVEPRTVVISELAEEQLRSPEVAAALRVFAGDVPRLRTALLQVLSVDVGRRPRKMPYINMFDGLAVQCVVAEGGHTEVQTVCRHDGKDRPRATVPPELDIVERGS